MEIRIMKIIKAAGSHLCTSCVYLPDSVAGGCPGCSVVGGSVACILQLPGDPSPVLPSICRQLSVKKNQNVSTKPFQCRNDCSWPYRTPQGTNNHAAPE